MEDYQLHGYVAGDERVIDLGSFGEFSVGYLRGRLEEARKGLDKDLKALREGKRVRREILDLEIIV